MADYKLIAVGLNWRMSPVSVREQIAFSNHTIPEALKTLRRFSGCQEAVILSTCNRVEIYASCEDPERTVPHVRDFLASFYDRDDLRFDDHCFVHLDKAAVRHILRVAAGLESMVVGENEILSQVKEAYRCASKEGAVGGVLALFMEYAIRVGRQIRRDTQISQGAVSVASVACDRAQKIFESLKDQRVLILGTGKMSTQTVRNLVREGAGEVIVAARNEERGLELADIFGVRAVDFSEWLRHLPDADIVISSTSAPHYVVHYEDVKRIMATRKHRPLFIIDIAVPRDVDPRVDELSDVYLYNIDDLKSVCESNIKLRQKEIHICQTMIESRVEQFFLTLEKLRAGPVIEALNRKFDDIAGHEVKEYANRWTPTPEQEADLKHLISSIKGKFLHHPMTRLKQAAESGGIYRYTETIHQLFDLDVGDFENDS